MSKSILLAATLAALTLAGTAQARDQIRIVGSSTVYPFSTQVAEQFGKQGKFKTPVVESTGTGGGLKLFCAGVGASHPDIANASRAIKPSEIEACAKNGVGAITEVKIGFDGIVLANNKSAKPMAITRKQLYLALAKQVPGDDGSLKPNPHTIWSSIDSTLPASKIEVLGPPPTSGTRDAFVELVMESGCGQFKWVKDLEKSDPSRHKAICQGVREDGAFVEAGENDILIVRKLEATPTAFGIFGFSFLDQNADKIQGARIDGVSPTFEAIAAGTYPVARPIFFYVKKAHAASIPGLKEFVAEFTSEKSWGEDGYLAAKGLIPLPKEQRTKLAKEARELAANVK
ncbi:MAG: substrate-binding domain-containing protein [Rhodospirillales bacterium]|nr:substrate-binding domain-containing protein [Rhodospirillales bacterium]